MELRTVEIPLPNAVCQTDTPAELIAGMKLFYDHLASWINFAVDGDIGGDEQKLREVFGAFITVAHLHREQPWRGSDADGYDVQVSHFDGEIPKILRQLGA